jgi:hypothetical protein
MGIYRVRGAAQIDSTLKLPSVTASRALIVDGSNNIAASATTSAELAFLSGVTSSVQTQLNDKLNLAGGTMTGLLVLSGDPVVANGAATKNYVDTLSQGLKWKASVKVASTANLTLSGTQTVDGIALVANDRILVKNQSTTANNGIYLVAAGIWTRALDMDSWLEVPAAAVFVEEGTVNADLGFVCTSNAGGTLNSTAITFVQFSNVLYTADGQGIELSSNQFSLELDGTTLSKSATGLKVADLGIANGQVSNSAAIAYSKLALSNSIVNADVATGAAIARTKLASGTANHVVINDGTGVLSSEAQLNVSRGGTGVNASTITNGQLLIGHDANNNFSLATLTAGANISITNGAGSITIAAAGNANDIPDTSFAGAANASNVAVTGFAFANANVRSFEALVSVSIDATVDLFEVFTIRGIQRGADWDLTQTSNGDDTLVTFDITNAGQIRYSSAAAYTGFVSMEISFRAITTAT